MVGGHRGYYGHSFSCLFFIYFFSFIQVDGMGVRYNWASGKLLIVCNSNLLSASKKREKEKEKKRNHLLVSK